MSQEVRFERQGFTCCRIGSGGGYFGKDEADGPEARFVMCLGSSVTAGVHLVVAGDKNAPVRSCSASQLWRVRMRRGEA